MGSCVWRRLFTLPAATATISPQTITVSSDKKTITIKLKTSNSKYPLSDVTANDLIGLEIQGRKSTASNYQHVKISGDGKITDGYANTAGIVSTWSDGGTYSYDPSTGTVTLNSNSLHGFDGASYSSVANVTVSRTETAKDYVVANKKDMYPSSGWKSGLYYELIGTITNTNTMNLSEDAISAVIDDVQKGVKNGLL